MKYRYEKRVKPSQGQLGLIRGLILSLFWYYRGYIIKCMKICELWRIKTSSKMEHLSKKVKYSLNSFAKLDVSPNKSSGQLWTWPLKNSCIELPTVPVSFRWIHPFCPKSKIMSNQSESYYSRFTVKWLISDQNLSRIDLLVTYQSAYDSSNLVIFIKGEKLLNFVKL